MGKTIACGDECIDPSTHNNNCGGCVADGEGKACTLGYQCMEGKCEAVCVEGCKNGGSCVAPNRCQCEIGWGGSDCSSLVCEPPCLGGECTQPKVCTCKIGWTGETCATPDRVRIPSTGKTTNFIMGKISDDDPWNRSSELPTRTITLSAYYIDRYPVTAASYALCVAAGRCTKPQNGSYATYDNAEKQDHPVNLVLWEQAKSYCEWAGGRLPTEAEWERAAKGTKNFLFPWGNNCPQNCNTEFCKDSPWSADTAKCNCSVSYCAEQYTATSPVNAFKNGKTPEGVYDLSGNVWEWVQDWFAIYPSENETDPQGPEKGEGRVLRGGGYSNGSVYLRSITRGKKNPEETNYSCGFRCAYSL
ncbi:MAG: SUMF1/EgtB/PvdO family nonheme iron enzyme [Bradymonadales bacterium]